MTSRPLPRVRWTLTGTAVCLGLLLALSVAAGVAEAHALLLHSQPNQGAVVPREPPVIHLWFSEDLNSSLSRAIVWDRRRKEVDLKNDTISNGRELTVSLRPGLPAGSYLVLWTSVSSEDGHVLKGAYLFSIGHPGPVPPAPSLAGSASENFPPNLPQLITLVARSIELAASAFWLGLALFLTIIIPATRSAGVALAGSATERASKFVPITLLTLLLARAVGLIVQAYTLGGGDWSTALSASTFNGLLLQTEYGHLWIAMQAAVAMGLLVSLAALFSPAHEAMSPGRSAEQRVFSLVVPLPAFSPRAVSPGAMLLVLAIVQTYLLAASGHAATVDLVHTGTGILTAPVAIDWLHLLASGVWVGGMFAVGLVLTPAMRTLGRDSLPALLDTLDRFSPFAYASVAVLAFSGGFNGKVHVPSWDAFFGSIYGRTLIVKILLVGMMILISAFTVGIIRPRLRRLLAGSRQDTEVGHIAYLQAILMRWLRIGAFLGLCVFVATSFLNTYPVPLTFGAVNGPFSLTSRSGSLSVTLKLSPGKAGPDTFTVLLRRGGRPVPLADVRILETSLDMNMGTQYLILNRKAPGNFTAQGQVAMGGHWAFEVVMRLPNQANLQEVFFRPVVGD